MTPISFLFRNNIRMLFLSSSGRPFVRICLPSVHYSGIVSSSRTNTVATWWWRSYGNVVSEDRLKKDLGPENPFPDALVHRTAEYARYAARQYLLLPPHVELLEALKNPRLAIASLFSRGHVIFGARLHQASNNDELSANSRRLFTICPPLLEAAIRDAPENEQPQAMSTLHGLCTWVVDGLEKRHTQCEVLEKLWQGMAIPRTQLKGREHDIGRPKEPKEPKEQGQDAKEDETVANSTTNDDITNNNNNHNSSNNNNNNNHDNNLALSVVQLEAVRAIATGIPRPGEKAIELQTMRDARDAWIALAREFVQKQPSDECQLYLNEGSELVSIQHGAERNPRYMASAGGAMARFYFV